MCYLESNLSCLKKHRKKLYEDIVNVIDREEYVFNKFKIINAKNGEKTIEIVNGGKIVRLNSLYNPTLEAKRWTKKYNFSNLDAPLLMFGIANGIFVREMLANLKSESIAVLVEPDISLFIFCLNEFYMEDIISDDRVNLFIDKINFEHIAYFLKNNISSKTVNVSIVCSHPYMDMLYHEKSVEFAEKIRQRILKCESDFLTYLEFNGREVENSVKNMHFLKKSNFVTELKGMIPDDVPFIIVAAGPSLEKNVDELKRAEGRAFIMALDTSVRTLLKHNIRFDAIACVDADKPVEYLSDKRCLEYPIFAAFTANNKILELNKGKKIWIVNTSQFLYTLYKKNNVVVKEFGIGGSVATAAFSIARTIGLKKIVLVGQDLAYNGELSHAGGVKEKGIANDRWTGYVEGINGEKVRTRADWSGYLRWFEDNIKVLDESMEVIDATEGGAKIHGTKIMRLSEVIDQYCVKKIDFKEIVKKMHPTFDENQYLEVRQDLLHLEQELLFIAECVKRGIEASKEMLTKIANNSVNADIEKEYSLLIKDTNEVIEEQLAYSIIGAYISKDIYLVMRTVNNIGDDKNENLKDTCEITQYVYEKMDAAIKIMKPLINENLKKI